MNISYELKKIESRRGGGWEIYSFLIDVICLCKIVEANGKNVAIREWNRNVIGFKGKEYNIADLYLIQHRTEFKNIEELCSFLKLYFADPNKLLYTKKYLDIIAQRDEVTTSMKRLATSWKLDIKTSFKPKK